MKWGLIFSRVFTIFLHWFEIVAVIWLAKINVQVSQKNSKAPASLSKKLRIYTTCILAAIGLSLVLAYTLGTHNEGGNGYDEPGETVVDYVPTDNQRYSYGIKLFLVLSIAGLIGTYQGLKEDKKLTLKEREARAAELDKPTFSDDW